MAINIKNFFNPEDVREYLSSPHKLDGKVIASTGHVLLVMPDHGDYPPFPVNFKSLDAIREHIKQAECRQYTPIPDNIKFPQQHDCNKCDGNGKAHIKECQECDGHGYVEFYNSHNWYSFDCKTCDGDGEIIKKGGETDCQNCAGTGRKYLIEASVEISCMYVSPTYLSYIINEPHLEISANIEKLQLYFRAGDVSGLIMGMRK